ncbi:uncharacterized protein LOC113351926 [Papaver somniferum]|uniref:uncharacterized protein LOC113351926 n=1 Tax=Papaver somniferum TaxID=3469 RepID=UPI000E6FE978|nr:uncharacterized protein LOC113351926 [Papaver somniferum]
MTLQSDKFPMCNYTRETDYHILMDYPFARAVWFGLSTTNRVRNNIDLYEWIITWLSNPHDWDDPMTDWEAVCGIVVWNIWKERCDMVVKELQPIPMELIRIIETEIVVPNSLINKGIKSSTEITRGKNNEEWKPPPFGKTKINFDASFKEGDLTVGPGFIDRNHSGTSGATTYIKKVATSALLTECLAAKEAIKWETSTNLTQMCISTFTLGNHQDALTRGREIGMHEAVQLAQNREVLSFHGMLAHDMQKKDVDSGRGGGNIVEKQEGDNRDEGSTSDANPVSNRGNLMRNYYVDSKGEIQLRALKRWVPVE